MLTYADVCGVYLLYWYKSANTDAEGAMLCAASCEEDGNTSASGAVNLLALLVQKYKY